MQDTALSMRQLNTNAILCIASVFVRGLSIAFEAFWYPNQSRLKPFAFSDRRVMLLLMILPAFYDIECTVNLFQHHDPRKMMRKCHRRHRKAQLCLLLE